MDRVALDDIEIEYEIRGEGEPVVFVHHGVGWADKVLTE